MRAWYYLGEVEEMGSMKSVSRALGKMAASSVSFVSGSLCYKNAAV
jgi:hypothetical protein